MTTTTNYSWTKPAGTDAADFVAALGAIQDQIDATVYAQLLALAAKTVPISARRTTDSTAVNNSTSLVNDTQLAVAVTANAVYHFEARIRYSSNSTANIKLAWTFPTGLTMDYEAIGGTTSSATFAQFNNTQSTILALGGFASDLSVMLDGIVLVGGTAGNLQLQFAQNTANSSNTLIRSGSYVQLTPIT